MVTVIGIDPGQDGAIAVLSTAGEVEFFDIGGSLVDAISFLRELKNTGRVRGVVIEKVHAFSKQGVASSFNFGCTYGHLRGACIALEIPIMAEPAPQAWKKAVFGGGIRGLEKEVQKRMARDKARCLYPQAADRLSRRKDADRAEALLLAHYGLEVRQNAGEPDR